VREKVAELAKLRRRRLIVQPRVAEHARLPWVFRAQRPTLQRVSRRVRKASSESLLLLRCPNRKSTLGTRVNPPPNPAKGFTESARHQSTPPQRFNPFRIGRRLSRRSSRSSSDWFICHHAESLALPCAHGVKPFAGLSAARSGTQGSLASSATLG